MSKDKSEHSLFETLVPGGFAHPYPSYFFLMVNSVLFLPYIAGWEQQESVATLFATTPVLATFWGIVLASSFVRWLKGHRHKPVSRSFMLFTFGAVAGFSFSTLGPFLHGLDVAKLIFAQCLFLYWVGSRRCETIRPSAQN